MWYTCYWAWKRYNDNNPEIEYPCIDKLNANWDPIWSNYDNSTANPPYGFGTKSNGEIMLNNGSATANDIEMVLYSFLENKMQSFTFQSKN